MNYGNLAYSVFDICRNSAQNYSGVQLFMNNLVLMKEAALRRSYSRELKTMFIMYVMLKAGITELTIIPEQYRDAIAGLYCETMKRDIEFDYLMFRILTVDKDLTNPETFARIEKSFNKNALVSKYHQNNQRQINKWYTGISMGAFVFFNKIFHEFGDTNHLAFEERGI